MTLLQLLQENTILFLALTTLLGLAVGSFLNVVIYRLPKMMEDDWHAQCRELLEIVEEKKDKKEPFNLMRPGSACPHCGHQIRAWENIPVFGWLMLRGKCSNCQGAISIRYPIVELVTGLLSLAVAWHFGFGWQTATALLLTWSLIALTLIDFDHQLLPDSIVLPLLWLGLFISLFGVFTDTRSAVIGAIAGYGSLWLVFQTFKLITGKEGMGYGDFKLFAAFGAWLGWQSLIQIILLSSVVGAFVGVTLILLKGRGREIPIPFGPYLAAAGWISLLWGAEINETYLRFSGLA
jgi:leader peptidase (prepilin peptidase)/N-methyltransferase